MGGSSTPEASVNSVNSVGGHPLPVYSVNSVNSVGGHPLPVYSVNSVNSVGEHPLPVYSVNSVNSVGGQNIPTEHTEHTEQFAWLVQQRLLHPLKKQEYENNNDTPRRALAGSGTDNTTREGARILPCTRSVRGQAARHRRHDERSRPTAGVRSTTR